MHASCSVKNASMISYTSVSKKFNAFSAINDFSLTVEKGEIMALIGPSGGGKTTALKMVNGIVRPDAGDVLVDSISVSQWDMQDLRHSVGYVIQQVGLFPHWTIGRNIGVLMQVKHWSPDRIRERTAELLELVELDPAIYRNRYPHELSGGQSQRVGLARALALSPPVMLMDEPFGALDPLIRAQMRAELLTILKTASVTTILVTHDLAEAFQLADRICVLVQGSVEQVGTPDDLIHNTQSQFISELMKAELIAEILEAGEHRFGCLNRDINDRIRRCRLSPGAHYNRL